MAKVKLQKQQTPAFCSCVLFTMFPLDFSFLISPFLLSLLSYPLHSAHPLSYLLILSPLSSLILSALFSLLRFLLSSPRSSPLLSAHLPVLLSPLSSILLLYPLFSSSLLLLYLLSSLLLFLFSAPLSPLSRFPGGWASGQCPPGWSFYPPDPKSTRYSHIYNNIETISKKKNTGNHYITKPYKVYSWLIFWQRPIYLGKWVEHIFRLNRVSWRF